MSSKQYKSNQNKSNSYKLEKYLKRYRETSEIKYLHKLMYYLKGGKQGDKCTFTIQEPDMPLQTINGIESKTGICVQKAPTRTLFNLDEMGIASPEDPNYLDQFRPANTRSQINNVFRNKSKQLPLPIIPPSRQVVNLFSLPVGPETYGFPEDNSVGILENILQLVNYLLLEPTTKEDKEKKESLMVDKKSKLADLFSKFAISKLQQPTEPLIPEDTKYDPIRSYLDANLDTMWDSNNIFLRKYIQNIEGTYYAKLSPNLYRQ